MSHSGMFHRRWIGAGKLAKNAARGPAQSPLAPPGATAEGMMSMDGRRLQPGLVCPFEKEGGMLCD